MFDDDGRDEILESPITLCCEAVVFGCQYSLGLLSMSRSTRNLNHWWSFVVHGLFYWLLLLLLLLFFTIFLFDVWFSFCRQFFPPVAELLSSFPGTLPPVHVVTPIHVDQFALELDNHSSQPQLSFVLEGLSKGFWVGYNYLRNLKSASRNKPSAYAHPDNVAAYLANEVSLGTVVGPSHLVFDLHHTSLIL